MYLNFCLPFITTVKLLFELSIDKLLIINRHECLWMEESILKKNLFARCDNIEESVDAFGSVGPYAM